MSLFNRNTHSVVPYINALKHMLKIDSEHKAMSENLMFDHRVSVSREKVFINYIQKPFTSDSLEKAIVNYFEDRIRFSKKPHFLCDKTNLDNIVCGTPCLSPKISKDLDLVRVVDLNGLSVVFQWAKSKNFPFFLTFPRNLGDDKKILKWLDHKLLNKPQSQVEKVLAQVINAMNKYRLVSPFQPTWVVPWTQFSKFIPGNPEKWLEVLGVKKINAPRWCFLLKYKAREAGTVVRPTQLDAGWYAYHYPSPPKVQNFLGGHPMDLSASSTDLISEYIHMQIDHTIDQWFNTGKACKRTTLVNNASLSSQRKAHLSLLNNKYGTNISLWASQFK